MSDQTPTTGLATVAAINITSSAPTYLDPLALEGTEQSLTYQVEATAVDIGGNVQSDVTLYYLSSDENIATVSDSGLVHAISPGACVIEVYANFANNTVGQANPTLAPAPPKVYAEQTVVVSEYGNGVEMVPDFSFTIDADSYEIDSTGSVSVTVTQESIAGFTGTVAYRILSSPVSPAPWNVVDQPGNQPGFGYIPIGSPATPVMAPNPVAPFPSVGFITGGSGTLTFTIKSLNAPAGTLRFSVAGAFPTFGAQTSGQVSGPPQYHNVTANLTVS